MIPDNLQMSEGLDWGLVKKAVLNVFQRYDMLWVNCQLAAGLTNEELLAFPEMIIEVGEKYEDYGLAIAFYSQIHSHSKTIDITKNKLEAYLAKNPRLNEAAGIEMQKNYSSVLSMIRGIKAAVQVRFYQMEGMIRFNPDGMDF